VLATVEELLARLEESEVAGQGLKGREVERQREQLRRLLEAPEPVQGWLAQGRVAEAVARAWFGLGDMTQAEVWYAKATDAPDATASLRAREQWLNLRVRTAGGNIAVIDAAIEELRGMLKFGKSAERWNLLGSAYKRRAEASTDPALVRESLQQMESAYAQALQIDPGDAYYPMLQGLLARLRLAWSGEGAPPDPAQFEALRRVLARKEAARADFWTAVAWHEVDLYEAVVTGQLAARAAGLGNAFADVYARIANASRWRSVLDTARFVLRAQQQVRPAVPQAELDAGEALLRRLEAYAQ
jgi:hypothetical protein